MSLSLALGVVLALSGISGAHWDEQIDLVVQFPDQAVPTIDGDLKDWNIVPPNYAIGNQWFNDARGLVPEGWTNADWDASDLDMRHMVGWNDNLNQLYLGSRIFDDTHDGEMTTHWNEMDNWEVTIDFRHTPPGEYPEDAVSVVQFAVWVPPPAGDKGWADAWPYPNPPQDWYKPGTEWWDVGWSYEGEMYGESTYFYEVQIQPWEFMPAQEPEPGDVMLWDLEEGQIIHLDLVVVDVDWGNNYREPGCCGYWSQDDNCCTAVNDWLLMELDEDLLANITSVETDSWGRIKAQFK
jgi:hypothetical protein